MEKFNRQAGLNQGYSLKKASKRSPRATKKEKAAALKAQKLQE